MNEVPKDAEELISLAEVDKNIADLDDDGRVRVLRKQLANLQKKLIEKETGRDLLKSSFDEAYSDPLQVKGDISYKSSGRSSREEVAVAHLSDVHFGKRTESYGIEVAESRVRMFAAKVLQQTDIRRSFAKIKYLRVYLGGDMVEGDGGIFPGQNFEMDSDIITQAIKTGPEIIADCILTWLKNFDKIHISGVPGNHGRSGKFKDKRLNYDSLFYDTLRRMVGLAIPEDQHKRVTWDLPFDRHSDRAWYSIDNIYGWGTMMVHGHQIRGMLGVPWYGVGKKVAGWIDVIPEPWNYLFMGHFHTDAKFVINRRLILANGTTETSNAYAAESMAASGEPVQRLCFFDKSHGLIVDSPIYLSDREPVA